jgi:hypothetical protein
MAIPERCFLETLLGFSLTSIQTYLFFTKTNLCTNSYVKAGANRYFTLCSTDFLAIGGGGHFALYLDSDL